MGVCGIIRARIELRLAERSVPSISADSLQIQLYVHFCNNGVQSLIAINSMNVFFCFLNIINN